MKTDKKIEHTLGEWVITDTDWEGQPVISCQGKTIAILTCGDEFSPKFKEAMANAKFIVKACNSHYELLEACKRLLQKADVWECEKADMEYYIKFAKQAISKAESEG